MTFNSCQQLFPNVNNIILGQNVFWYCGMIFLKAPFCNRQCFVQNLLSHLNCTWSITLKIEHDIINVCWSWSGVLFDMKQQYVGLKCDVNLWGLNILQGTVHQSCQCRFYSMHTFCLTRLFFCFCFCFFFPAHQERKKKRKKKNTP